MAFHIEFPSKTLPYEAANISPLIVASRSATSFWLGQMSERKTGLPFLSMPIGSLVRFTSARPARANATTSGGDAR